MTVREFIVALLNHRPEVTVAPADDIQAATRDIATIDRWKKQGKELVLLGIGLKDAQPTTGKVKVPHTV